MRDVSLGMQCYASIGSASRVGLSDLVAAGLILMSAQL